MSEQRDPPDAEMLQERMRVRGQLLEAVLVALRLARLAKTDLVRSDDAPARLAQRPDGELLGSGAEVLPVQQHDRPSVRALRSNVEVAHVQHLLLRLQIEALDGPRVIETFEFRPVCRRVRTRRSGGKCHEENTGQAADDHVRLIPPGLLERNNCRISPGYFLRRVRLEELEHHHLALRRHAARLLHPDVKVAGVAEDAPQILRLLGKGLLEVVPVRGQDQPGKIERRHQPRREVVDLRVEDRPNQGSMRMVFPPKAISQPFVPNHLNRTPLPPGPPLLLVGSAPSASPGSSRFAPATAAPANPAPKICLRKRLTASGSMKHMFPPLGGARGSLPLPAPWRAARRPGVT